MESTYRPGKVVVIGYKDGIEVCRDSIQTSGNKAVRFYSEKRIGNS